MSVFTSCSNTRSKSVAKWHNCHINELVKQIILYRPQNALLARIPRNDVGQLWHVSLVVFQHSIPHMITHWHIDLDHWLLFLHQNRCVVICSLRNLSIATIIMKYAAYVAWILLCETCKFGEKICYSNWNNEFYLRDCFYWRTLYIMISHCLDPSTPDRSYNTLSTSFPVCRHSWGINERSCHIAHSIWTKCALIGRSHGKLGRALRSDQSRRTQLRRNKVRWDEMR